MTNTSELEKKIQESGLKKSFIAKGLNLSRQAFKNKCENKSTFDAMHISVLCEMLNITSLQEKERIFFAK